MRLTELISAYADAERVHPEHRELFRKLQRVALDTVYAENERAGEARQVVADVARVFGTDIDAGPGHRWDEDHMRRVVAGSEALRDERDEHRTAAEQAETKLRKLEHGCETPESHDYGCPCDGDRIEFRGGSITHQWDPATVRIDFDAGRWDSVQMFVEENEGHRTVAVQVDRCVWIEFAQAVRGSDPVARSEAEKLRDLLRVENERANAAIERERVGEEAYDDLKAIIVSQAREIARLKGESA